MRRVVGVVASAAVMVAALSGCVATVALEPAPDANNPLCAEVSVRLPAAVGEFERRWTDAQATGAWGSPAAMVMSCGVPVPAPTSELVCITLDGVDWLIDESQSPWLRTTTYGRDPAVQAFVNTEVLSGDRALLALADAVRSLEQTRECTALGDESI